LQKNTITFNMTSSNIGRHLQKYWGTTTVSGMKIKNGDRLLLEFAVFDKAKKTWNWPRFAAASAGEKWRLEEEDRVFKAFLKGFDVDGNALEIDKMINEKVDVMDNKGRWWRAVVADVELSGENDVLANNLRDDEEKESERCVMRLLLSIPDYGNRKDWILASSDALAPLGRYTTDENGIKEDDSDVASVEGNAQDSLERLDVASAGKNSAGKKVQQKKYRRNSRGPRSYTQRHNHSDDEPIDAGICAFPGFGACGLANLGNTCYANAALQCVSYMPLMRGYLLGKQFLKNDDINRDNPLGTGGVLLEGYYELLKQMWSGKQGFFVPREFRKTLGKCKQQFSTNEQQDAQELLAELLDMLHEDGNKVKKKPMVPSIEDAWMEANSLPRIALEAWRRHLRRNRSAVTSLNYGQIYNKVTCPVCNKTSTTFDPFSMLSVPIPSASEAVFRVTLYRRSTRHNTPRVLNRDYDRKEQLDDGDHYPPSQHLVAEQYAISVPKLSDAGDLKLQIQNLCGISRDRLTVCELMADERQEVPTNAESAVLQQFFACMELNNQDPCSKILEKSKASMGTGTFRSTYLVCYESTVNLKRVDCEFNSDEMMADLIEQEKSSEDYNPRESEQDAMERRNLKLDDIYNVLYNRNFLEVYAGPDEGRVHDHDVLLFAKILSEKRWPQEMSDINEKLVGLRLDFLDERVWLQASVTAVLDKADDSDDSDHYSDEEHEQQRSKRVRIHFDRFASKWDKVITLDAFKSRRIMPLHTHSKPKSPTFKLNLYHRHSNSLFGVQQFVQFQNEWTTCRAFAAVLIQVTRHVSESNDCATLKEVIDALLDADARFLKMMDDFDTRATLDPHTENKRLRRKIRDLLKALPFTVTVMGNQNPAGGGETAYSNGRDDGTTSEVEMERKENGVLEEDFDYSLVRTIGNSLNPRLCVVVSWEKKKAASAYMSPAIHIHERSEMEVREKERLLQEQQAAADGSNGGNSNHDDAERESKNSAYGQQQEQGDEKQSRVSVPLHSCLKEYCKEQTLSVNDFWCCSTCKDIREGKQSMSLWRLPDILTIHMKRFNCSERWKEKITTRVNFPVTGLDMSQHVDPSAPKDSNIYDLFGVINHLGGIHGGHYIAFAKATSCEPNGVEEVCHTFNGAMASGCIPVEPKVADMGGTGGFFSIGKKKTADKDKDKNADKLKEMSDQANFIRTSAEPFWVSIDDDTAEPLGSDKIITDSAYVLFYRRRRLSPSLVASMTNM
jgi:ubiquitin C-terminal hydrolase